MKKAFVTGHTSGVGKAIFNYLIEKGWSCEGFSRSNSFDILKPAVRNEIVEKCAQGSLFINNAHAGYAQAQLLSELFESWQHDEGKCIINIGVDTVPASNWEVVYRSYPVEKVALHAEITRLQNEPHKCRILNLALGHIETVSNSKYKGKKLGLAEVTSVIDFYLSINSQTYIKQINLGPR